MMQLNNTYNRDDFLRFLEENFLTDFKKDIRPASTQGSPSIQKAYSLGRSESLDLQVFEFSFEGSSKKRVTLTKDAFQIMRSSAIFRALAIFHSPGSDDWRLSLMTATPERTEKGKVALTYSNPKRLSFFLGPNAKIKTPTNFILKKGRIIDFEDLKSRFSIEIVNKEFYKEISELFTQLVGGSVSKGKIREEYEPLLKLPSIQDKSQTSLEFAVRLIGRVIFCWFLREKKSDQGKSLMPNDLLSLEAAKNNPDYYHKILEPIFFEVLNKPVRSRKDSYAQEPFSSIPYLNGGLFSPHEDDFFSYNEGKQAVNHNMVVIPDEWLREFFGVLETYNFTIDENTGFDEELSIDPEMLGRIFENLLAEINPETGESARKNTGSYYTPRVIVDYMVDESLLLYLKQHTQISEEKLRAVISYDLHDDEENPLIEDERERIISALERVKILDPACGSGAFPIGALQKIVFILQQADPIGQLWFKKQIKNTSPEIRRVIEREFAHKNFDYIRKLGIIRENIYGVDIQPIATEISRLRCFLTLVVDERIQEAEENRGIEPLPNLDFKFVTANALIGLPGTQMNSQIGLFEDDAGIMELKELRDMFFNATGTEREQLKLQFVQAQNRMFQRLISEGRRGHADLTTKLSTWDPFSHKSASWFDTEWMFGIGDGFDIVIANPPWVFGGNSGITVHDKELFKKMYASGTKKINLFSIFVEKGCHLLKQDAYLTYILPNTMLRVTSYSNIREFLIKNTEIREVVDLDVGIFENVTASTIILTLRNKIPALNNEILIKKGVDTRTTNILKQSDFNGKGYIFNIFASDKNRKIISKLKSGSIPLGTLAKYIRFGVVITKNHDEIVSNYKPDKEWKPFLEGSEIGSYVINYEGRYLNYRKNLLHRSRTPDVFETKKILIQRITGGSQPLKAAYDTNNFYDKESIINLILKNNDEKEYKYILGLLNSSLMNWFYNNSFTNESKLTVNLSREYLSEIPIRELPSSIQTQFLEVVDKILSITISEDFLKNSQKQSQVKEYEKQIDQIVYKLYGLTEEEIKTVEEQTSVRSIPKLILENTLATEAD